MPQQILLSAYCPCLLPCECGSGGGGGGSGIVVVAVADTEDNDTGGGGALHAHYYNLLPFCGAGKFSFLFLRLCLLPRLRRLLFRGRSGNNCSRWHFFFTGSGVVM